MSNDSTTRCGRCGTIDGCVCVDSGAWQDEALRRTRVKPENQPAFPEVPADCNGYEGRAGMTLRDHFAGKALPQTIAAVFEIHPNGSGTKDFAETCATLAYQMADAMLAAREVKP